MATILGLDPGTVKSLACLYDHGTVPASSRRSTRTRPTCASCWRSSRLHLVRSSLSTRERLPRVDLTPLHHGRGQARQLGSTPPGTCGGLWPVADRQRESMFRAVAEFHGKTRRRSLSNLHAGTGGPFLHALRKDAIKGGSVAIPGKHRCGSSSARKGGHEGAHKPGKTRD
jgi:hypothetical protein